MLHSNEWFILVFLPNSMPHQWKTNINVIFPEVCKHEVKHFYSRSSRYQASVFCIGWKIKQKFYSPGSQTWWWRAGPEWVTTGPKRSGTPGRTCVQRQKAQSQFYCIALILQCWHNKSRCVDSGHTCWPPRTSSPSSSSGPRRSGCQTLGLTRAGSSRWSGAEGKKTNYTSQQNTKLTDT